MFTLASMTGASAQLAINRPADAATGRRTRKITEVVEAVSRTYYLKPDEATQTTQLMQDNGPSRGAVPVVDNVVGLSFNYYGDPDPAGAEEAGQRY